MIERLIVALVLLALGAAAYAVVNRRQIRRATALATHDPLLSGLKTGVATTCIPCKTQQMPALNRLQQELGEAVQIVRVDATEDPDAAQRWGVLSVPTTFVLDASGTTRAVNHGVTETAKLRQQLSAA